MLKHPKPHSLQKTIITIILLLGIAAGGFLLLNQNGKTNTYNHGDENFGEQTKTEEQNKAESDLASKPIPKELQLVVPFTPQAPTANWDELHNEACEEASIIMANAYFNNITSLPPTTVEKEISKLTEYQKKTFGYYLSITTPEAARMTEEVYGLKAEMKTMTEQVIKQALSNGQLVILPANGQMLGNPYFTAPGPIYHMLVITGYDGSTFITNDPGTRRGHNYKYDYKTLYEATGNWNHNTHEVDLSDKRIIIVSK